jgi:hypothetical protein
MCTRGVSKSFRTGRLERELQMLQLSATRCSCIAILWVSLVSFAAITLCVTSQRSVYCCLFRYRLSPETFGYTLVSSRLVGIQTKWERPLMMLRLLQYQTDTSHLIHSEKAISTQRIDFFFVTTSRRTLGFTQAPIQWVPDVLVYQPVHQADHSAPPSAEANNMDVFIACCLVEHKYIFS